MVADAVTREFANLASGLSIEPEDDDEVSLGGAPGLYGISAALAQQTVIWGLGPGQPGYDPSRRRTAGDPDFVPTIGPSPNRAALLLGNLTVEESMGWLYTFDPRAELLPIQQLLLAGGFYSKSYYSRTNPEDVQYGIPDKDTERAWAAALERAAKTGKSIWEVLGSAAKNSPTFARRGAGGGGGGVRTVVLTDPAELRKLVGEVGRSVYGRLPDDPQLVERFVDSYRTQEGAFQRSAAAGGTVTRPAAAEVQAENALRQAAPTEALAHDFAAGTFEEFQAMLGGGG